MSRFLTDSCFLKILPILMVFQNMKKYLYLKKHIIIYLKKHIIIIHYHCLSQKIKTVQHFTCKMSWKVSGKKLWVT